MVESVNENDALSLMSFISMLSMMSNLTELNKDIVLAMAPSRNLSREEKDIYFLLLIIPTANVDLCNLVFVMTFDPMPANHLFNTAIKTLH